MKSASTAVRETTVPMKDAAAAAKATTQQLLEITKATADKISSFSDDVGASVTETKEIIETLYAVWEEQTDQLRGADDELKRAFSVISQNLTGSLSTLSDFNQKMDTNLGRAVEGLGSVVEELNDSVEALRR